MMGRGQAGAYRAFVACTVDDIVLRVYVGGSGLVYRAVVCE